MVPLRTSNTNVTNNVTNNHSHKSSMHMVDVIPRQKELLERGSPRDEAGAGGIFEEMAAVFSQSATEKVSSASYASAAPLNSKKSYVQLVTLLRVGIPSVLAGVASTFLFPALAMFLASIMNDAGVFAVLSQDSSQFVQNFLTVSGLLFSILVGQTYYFMYQQQENLYYALFNEVTEAKSLLEQVALVCQGRSMYKQVLQYISNYVEYDLKQLQCDPAILLSARPVDDPLESIMYMTSVGVPSTVYETVRSLRQARATRLGALQRKLPKAHMILLWVLAVIELASFPLLGAGTQTIGGYNILTVEGCLFGVMTFGIVMTLRVRTYFHLCFTKNILTKYLIVLNIYLSAQVVGELWRPAGGAYNVDSVLAIMVKGLEEELRARRTVSMSGSDNGSIVGSSLPGPDGSTGRVVADVFRENLLQQGSGGVVSKLFSKIKAKIFSRQ